MAELELRHLRAICAIAEEGSVSRAAARLGVTQPALTAQLRSIERMIGGDLFDRSPNGSVPTELGRGVLRSARIVLDDMTALLTTARGTSSTLPADTPLVVAFIPLLFSGALITELRAWFRCSELRTEVDSSGPVLLDMVAAKRADLVVFERFEGMEHRQLNGVEVRTLVEEPLFVAVSAESKFADQTDVDLAELADLDWVAPPPDQDAQRLEFRAACEQAGFTPRITHHVTDARTALGLAAAGAVCLASAPSINNTTMGYVIRPLRNMPMTSAVQMATRTDGIFAGRQHEVFACVAHAYQTIVERSPLYAKWWAENPHAHAELDAALALPRPSRPH